MKFMRTIRYWLLFSWLAVAGFAAVVVTGARLQSLSPSMELDKKAAAAFDLTPVRKLIADAVENQKVPSASLLLIHNDKVIFKEAYGYANIEKKEPMRVGTFVRLASSTKWITGATLAAAMEDGKLSLDDTVRSPNSAHVLR
jgi:CubicO group peptidase (beta-lactamase class C family)